MSRGRISYRLDPRNWFGSRSRGIIALAVIVLLIVDLVFAFYIINYSVDEVEVDIIDLQEEVLSVERSGYSYLIQSSQSVHLMRGGVLTPYTFLGAPTSIAIGDDTGAVAITTADGMVQYFPPNQLTPGFSVGLEGEPKLVGIGERLDPQRGYLPEQIAIVVTNATGDHLVLLSIEEPGEIFWEYAFESGVVCYDRSAGARYITVGLEDGSLMQFKRLESLKNVLALDGPPVDIELSSSGIKQAVLYGEKEKHLALFSVNSDEPEFTVPLPETSEGLFMQGNADRFFVLSGSEVLRIADGSVTLRASHEGIETFMAAPAVNQLFVATGDSVYAYRGERGAPIWKADAAFEVAGMVTDEGANLVVLWGGTEVGTVDNSGTVLGSGILWAVLGFLLLAEVIGIPVAIWWKKIVNLRTELAYLILAGLIGGIIVSVLLPDAAAIDWYGGEVTFHMVAASISVVAAIICWKYEAGLATLAMGFAIGIISAVPIALTAHFILSLAGHEFADSAFSTIIYTVLTGMKMGIVGGAVGLLLARVRRIR